MIDTEATIAELTEKLASSSAGDRLHVADDVRFFLAKQGSRPLIVFGVNPSTATDIKNDATIDQVERIVNAEQCDGWIMLNLYPQRTTDPKGLHKKDTYRQDYIDTNEAVIKKVLETFPESPLLAAWGNTVDERPYLGKCRNRILEIAGDREWLCIGPVTNAGNPHHPLYVKSSDIGKACFDESGKATRIERN